MNMHPKRASIHLPSNIGDRIADGVTNFFGTWLCLGLHTVWFTLWFAFRLDVALLTNIVSLEAIGLAILIMMSQARSGARDRQRDDVEAKEVDELYNLNLQQVEILQQQNVMFEQQNKILDLLKEKTWQTAATPRKQAVTKANPTS